MRAIFICMVNSFVYVVRVVTTSVQVRMPDAEVSFIDALVKQGCFSSRSDAIKTIVALYREREKTREFYNLLERRSEEARLHPERLILLDDEEE